MDLAPATEVPRAHVAGWPEPVRRELDRRAVGLYAAAVERARSVGEGRVLSLDDPDGRARLADGPAEDGSYDVVVSVAALVEVADLPGALARIHDLLTPDGWFCFIEPVVHPGWRGVLRASVGAHLPAVRQQHLGRDVPLAARANRLLITDIERFEMPTPVWPLRSFVQSRAIIDRRSGR